MPKDTDMGSVLVGSLGAQVLPVIRERPVKRRLSARKRGALVCPAPRKKTTPHYDPHPAERIPSDRSKVETSRDRIP
jgi:hypothetical protein